MGSCRSCLQNGTHVELSVHKSIDEAMEALKKKVKEVNEQDSISNTSQVMKEQEKSEEKLSPKEEKEEEILNQIIYVSSLSIDIAGEPVHHQNASNIIDPKLLSNDLLPSGNMPIITDTHNTYKVEEEEKEEV